MQSRNQYVEVCREALERVLTPGQTLVQYVRTKKGAARGVVVAFRNPRSNEVNIGWSLCNTKAERFDKNIGLNKAVARAVDINVADNVEVAQTVTPVFRRVLERAKKFFKLN